MKLQVFRPLSRSARACGLRRSDWHRSTERNELLALYAEADAQFEGWRCACSEGREGGRGGAECCHFAVIGREPHPTAVELEEVRHAMRRRPEGPSASAAQPSRSPRAGSEHGPAVRLPLFDLRTCPLLSHDGRCTVYASRPFGCRTFYCDDAEAPFDARPKLPRELLRDIGRRIADLSARFAPRDPHPRPLVRALAAERR